MMAFEDYDLDGDLDGYLLTSHIVTLARRDQIKKCRLTFRDNRWQVPDEFLEVIDVVIKPDGTPARIKAGQYDHLYRNNGDGTFTDVTRQAGIGGNGVGVSATWWDFNGDGYPDLYVANDYKKPDHLYRNNEDGTFTDVIRETMPHTPFYSMGSDAGDVNNDGRLDFMGTDMSATTSYKQKVGMGEMEKDGWFLESSEPRQTMRNALYLSSGTERFMEIAYLAGLASTDWTWTIRFADLDNDGWVRYVTLARGFMSAGEPVAHFGLGEDDRVETLTVRWPSGHVQQFEDLAPDRLYTINEPPLPPQKGPTSEASSAATMFIPSDALQFIDHLEMPYDDFERQPLLPQRMSQLGPGIAFGDVDGDGDEDVYVGGAAGQPGMLYLRDGPGRFRWGTLDPFAADTSCEDMAPLFFDADADGDMDLYVVSGGGWSVNRVTRCCVTGST